MKSLITFAYRKHALEWGSKGQNQTKKVRATRWVSRVLQRKAGAWRKATVLVRSLILLPASWDYGWLLFTSLRLFRFSHPPPHQNTGAAGPGALPWP